MLRIGKWTFDMPVVQAALSGYSDEAMRLIARRFGCPYAIHEVKLDKSIVHSRKTRRILLGELYEEDHPVGGQILGAQPDAFAGAAEHMVAHGFDIIDINFGCPVKKVLGRHRGGYLLSDPPTAIAIMRAVREVVPPEVPVTVKMRRGMDDTPESEQQFFRIFDAACKLGLDAITVHGRTVLQRYRGRADWGFLTRVRKYAPQQTLLGSGDLFGVEAIVGMLEQTGVDGVTVARGCIGNPWIFRDVRARLSGKPIPDPPSVAEQGRVIREHFELSAALHGAKKAARLLRKTGIKYAEVHPCPSKVRMAFVAASNEREWLAVLDEWYDPQRDWPPGRRKTGPEEIVATGATL
jgi:nifR3 family TIM-barrel protein